MADGRSRPGSRRSKDREILRMAVEDASRFLFTPEAMGDETAAPPPRVTPAPAGEAKPHYHDHRARLRARFDDAGPQALADYELLELLLFRSVPRRDTKPLAKALLARFGDLAAVLAADPARISDVPGAGPSIAFDLTVIQAVLERAARAEVRRKPVIGSWTQLVQYCRTGMAHATREQFRVLFLDVKNNLIADDVLGEGTIDHAPVYPREVARRALEHGAASAILVHNHPSGDPRPSAADVAITREVVAAAKAVGVVVHDHIVIGRDGAASLKSLNLM